MRSQTHPILQTIDTSIGDSLTQVVSNAAESRSQGGQEALLALAQELARQAVNDLWATQTED